MSRNGAGTYSLYPGVNPVVTGTTITSSWANNTLSDLATAMTASIANDGQTPILANLPMSTYRHTGVGNAVARTDYAAAGQVQDSTFLWGGTAGGTADALTITLAPVVTAWAPGQRFLFVSGASPNATTTPTLSPNGVTAKTFVRKDGTAIAAGDIPASTLCEAVYDGTNVRLVNWGAALLTQLGIVTSGTWNGSIITGAYGGTGVNNGTKTITLGGNLTTSGTFATTLTVTGATNVTLPTSGTLVTGGSITTSGLTQNTSRLLGRTTASAGAIEEISVGSGLTLSAGSLSSTVTSALSLITTITPTAAANVDALSAFSASYDNYLIIGENLAPAVNDLLAVRFATSGAADSSTNYSNPLIPNATTTTTTNTSFAALSTNPQSASSQSVSFVMEIQNVNDATNMKVAHWRSNCFDGTNYADISKSGVFIKAAAVTGVRFFWNGANNFKAQGSIKIYAIQNS